MTKTSLTNPVRKKGPIWSLRPSLRKTITIHPSLWNLYGDTRHKTYRSLKILIINYTREEPSFFPISYILRLPDRWEESQGTSTYLLFPTGKGKFCKKTFRMYWRRIQNDWSWISVSVESTIPLAFYNRKKKKRKNSILGYNNGSRLTSPR